MRKALLRLMMVCAPFMLSACGEGWEVQRTDQVFPYGNQRTAGTGVVYVRAKMMPEKELKLEPVAEEPPMEEPVAEAPKEEPAPVLDAEEIFEEVQTKGGKTIKVKKQMPAEDHSSAAPMSEPEEDHSAAEVDSIDAEQMASEETEAGDEMSAEDYISHAPKTIEAPSVEVIDAQPTSVVISREAHDMGDEVIETYENNVEQAAKEIVLPKKDVVTSEMKGKIHLDEIYQDPLQE